MSILKYFEMEKKKKSYCLWKKMFEFIVFEGNHAENVPCLLMYV